MLNKLIHIIFVVCTAVLLTPLLMSIIIRLHPQLLSSIISAATSARPPLVAAVTELPSLLLTNAFTSMSDQCGASTTTSTAGAGVATADSNSCTTAAAATYCAAFVTVPNMEVAKKIASGLVSSKLAACVNIVPGVTSIYEWEGKIEEDSELILMIKSRCSRTEDLTAFVKKNHPYDVCEVITTPILGGNLDYLKWIGSIVKDTN